jgi:hypothetical protein
LYIFIPSYAGNGGYQSMHPDVAVWLSRLLVQLKSDERIEHVTVDTLGDTPITMTRNRAVLKAREAGADLLLMVDSDQSPDLHRSEKWFKPFWDEAFEEVYKHYDKGPLVIGAPYCGPPDGGENVYVFYFDNFGIRGDETRTSLKMYDRQMAYQMSGIQECGALPTGMILFDMRIFDLMEPPKESKSQILDKLLAGEIDKDTALRSMSEGWFYYEWKNGYAAEKASTEDVTVTRDISFVGMAKLGYNPLRCAWDSWIGHHKPWNVGKPQPYTVEYIGPTLQRAYESGLRKDETIQQFEASPEVMDLFKVVA